MTFRLNFESPRWIVFFSMFGWFVTGYAFFTLIVFTDPIGNHFFHTDNPSDTQYIVFGIIAITLLARFAGGIVLGRLGDTHGRLFVIRISLISITVLTLVSALFPFSKVNIELVPIFFLLSRILIGFFTGGLWPTGGVYALEKIQQYNADAKLEEYKKEHRVKTLLKKYLFPSIKDSGKKSKDSNMIKKFGWQSSWIQTGFHFAIFMELMLKISFINSPDYFRDVTKLLSEYFTLNLTSLVSLPFETQWFVISLAGGIIGTISILLSMKMSKSKIWFEKREKIRSDREKKKIHKQNSDEFFTYPHCLRFDEQDIKQDAQKPLPHKMIVNLWLIMAGVMYLFYSTMAMITGYFPRSDYLVSLCNWEYCHWVYGSFVFIMVALAAHLIPGRHLSDLWNDPNPDIGPVSIFNTLRNFFKPAMFYNFLIRYDLILWLKRRFPKFIGKTESEDELFCNYEKNKDLQIILTHGYIALYMAIFALIVFSSIFLVFGHTNLIDNNFVQDSITMSVLYYVIFAFIVILLFVVISTWSIIPSTLSSMFPIARRNFWTSSIYTGGVIVGFAAPFVSIQIIQQYDHVWLLLPLIFGCISIIVGSRSLITSNPNRPGDNMLE